jgi:hypothetical protein
MNIDEQILLNKLAQGLADLKEGEGWFTSLGERERRDVLRDLNFMILNASPQSADVTEAIVNSALKPTFTPCVLLSKGEIRQQLAKIANLPEGELQKSFRLLIALLGVSDARRRRERPLDTVNHWWHRDLSDPNVIEAIRREFSS